MIELLDYLDVFAKENPGDSQLNITDFLGYLNSEHDFRSVKRDSISGGNDEWLGSNNYKNGSYTDISILVVMLFRYAKGYIKKALKNSEIKSADDFSYMITLLTYESMTKIELTNMQVMEKTSGNEIINRLIRLGFIEQSQDNNDKRSVRVKLTDTGQREIFKVLPEMQKVSKIVTGNLSENEINTLAYLLRKLDKYHNDIYNSKKYFELDQLI